MEEYKIKMEDARDLWDDVEKKWKNTLLLLKSAAMR
jgi:hypothetical protein